MNLIKSSLKIIGYLVLVVLLLIQLLAILGATNLTESLLRIGVVFAILLFFAIRWQKRNKKTDENVTE